MFQSLTVVYFICIKRVAMQLTVDQALGVGFIPINTLQQRASLPFKPNVLERKVYNNDDITLFSVLTFAKHACVNVLQHSPHRDSTCNTLLPSGLPNIYTQKRMIFPLNLFE